MPAGRPPKPQTIRTLEGNRSKREIPAEIEAEGVPVKPAGLCEIASAHWDTVTGNIHGWGIATRADSASLEQMCRYWALWQSAMSLSENDPSDKNARLATVAYGDQWRKLAVEFGLTPVARTRIAIQELKKVDALEDFVAKGAN